MKQILIFLICCASVFGVQTCTFDNDGGGGDSAWSTTTNWNGSVADDEIPVAGDTVIINANCTLDVVTPPSLTALTVNAGTTLTNGTATSLTVTGAITLAGTLTDTALVTVSAGTITSSGSGTWTAGAATLNTITCPTFGGGSATVDLLTVSGTGSLTITGDVIGQATGAGGDAAIYLAAASVVTLEVTGDATGGAAANNSRCIELDPGATSAIITVGGDLSGGAGGTFCYGVQAQSIDTALTVGSISGGSAAGSAGFNGLGTGNTLTCGTLVLADDTAPPIVGIFTTYSVTSVTVNGTALGGSGGGYRSRYNFN